MYTTARRHAPTRAQVQATGALTTRQLALMALEEGFSLSARRAAESELRLRALVDPETVRAEISAVLAEDTA